MDEPNTNINESLLNDSSSMYNFLSDPEMALISETWMCGECENENEYDLDDCDMCEAPNPHPPT